MSETFPIALPYWTIERHSIRVVELALGTAFGSRVGRTRRLAFERLRTGGSKESLSRPRWCMLATCAFRRERIPEESLVRIEAAGYSATICENCLTLLIVHRRYHNLNLERLILQISAK